MIVLLSRKPLSEAERNHLLASTPDIYEGDEVLCLTDDSTHVPHLDAVGFVLLVAEPCTRANPLAKKFSVLVKQAACIVQAAASTTVQVCAAQKLYFA